MNGFDLSTISSLYVGSIQYSSLYYGSTLIWPQQSGGGNSPIVFEDSTVESILLSRYDNDNKGYLTPEDCAAVTSLNNVFKNNTSITKFNEFKYFTGLAPDYNTNQIYINNYFSGCTSLTEITFPVNSSGNYYVWHDLYSDKSPLYGCTALTKVDLNGALFDENYNAGFYRGCTSLTGNQNLVPSNYIKLPISMFLGTTNLEHMVIPEGIQTNDSGLFQNSRTSYVIFPKSFITLNLDNITRDNSVTSGISIYLKRTSSITQLLSTSTGYNRKLIFYVPDSLLSAYQSDSNWSTVLSNNSSWQLKSDNQLPSDLLIYKD